MASKRQQFFVIYPLALGIAFLLYKYINPSESILFPKCIIKTLSDYDCPGCGGQRAVHQLLDGNIYLAFQLNPLLFILLPYLVLGFYLQLVPHPTPSELQLKRSLYGSKAIIIAGIIIFIYTLFRNIA